MRKLLLCAWAAIVFVACGKDDFGLNSQPEPQNPYAVTPEEAVQMLQSVIGGETTRSISVSDIQTLNKSAFVPSTRSGADEEAIYIVDIEGKGSAIMSADKRMEPIYAIMDKTKLSAEKLLGAATRSASDEGEDIEDYILGLLNNAIQHDIEEAGQRALPPLTIIPRDELWNVTTVMNRQDPLMNTSWHQYEPFNNSYPICDNTGERYAAGCGPIALAQIIYCNKFPNTIGSLTFDWDFLEQYEDGNNSPSNTATIEVASFVYKIKEESGASYATNGTTGLNISDARKFMRDIGYRNTSIEEYSLSNVITMVHSRKLPVYIRGTNQFSSSDRHAWVIDGCNIYKVDLWVRHYIDDITYNEFIDSTFYYNLLHCNFGWGDDDNLNGYYTSGIFNPSTRVNYNTDLQLIMYSK